MPAITAGAILVAIPKIVAVVKGVKTAIDTIKAVKEKLANIREVLIPKCWCNTTNKDSEIFVQRMQELDTDIQKALRDLDEYVAMIEKVRAEYERTQSESHQNAVALQSPGNR